VVGFAWDFPEALPAASPRPFKRDHNTIPIKSANATMPPIVRADWFSRAHAFRNLIRLSQLVASGVFELADTGRPAGGTLVVPVVAGVAKAVGAVGPVVVAGVPKGDGAAAGEVADEVADGGNADFLCEDWFPDAGLLRLV
jgi:hypothetical protein